LDRAAETIAKIRSRWKEAATGDILDGQLSLKRGDIPSAREHFAEALKKDPDNKIVQFWKAQLDSRTGSVSEAAKALEELVRNHPSKEVDTGVSLMSAAQSALASLSLQTENFDDAIRRFEELKRNSETGSLNRIDRWQLITAYAARDRWPLAKRELAAILNDTKTPPTEGERVRGANIYRQQHEDAAALAQLDYVLKVNPTNPAAVVTRAYIFLTTKNYDQSGQILRRAIELASAKKEKPAAVFYLMLAAVENESPPASTKTERARAALEQGLEVQPQSIELLQAEYLLLTTAGDPRAAVALIEEKAKNDPKGVFRRLLVDVLREQRDYPKAEQLLRDLARESKDDLNLAAALVQVISLQAADAAAAGKIDLQRSLDKKALTMIREELKRNPSSLILLQTECDLAARGGDFNRAIAITEEIDKLAPASTTGPLLRARLYARQQKTSEVARAYSEALERNPRQPDIRVLLGQELIKLGDSEGAVKQARMVLDVNKERLDATLLEARALGSGGSTDAQKEAGRQAAVGRLEAAIAQEPRFREAYQALADIEQARGRRTAAIDALKRDLKVNPQDSAAVARLIQLMAGPAGNDKSTSVGDLEEARTFAEAISQRDQEGSLVLAAGVGFHKVGRFELALPFSEKGAKMLDNPVAHLNLGDLLLSMAESQQDSARARPIFERAVLEYDQVLKTEPAQVEAVNNKAWVLHTYLGRSQQALELAEGLIKRTSPSALPGEFYDTLGAIQESLGRKNEAEQSYQLGLSRSPDHPVLNYHFGKMLAGDRNRTARAKGYLAKALAAREQLSPAMAQDAEGLIKQLSGTISGN
jgi:tetratricopeptide (TPR) repeat protein